MEEDIDGQLELHKAVFEADNDTKKLNQILKQKDVLMIDKKVKRYRYLSISSEN